MTRRYTGGFLTTIDQATDANTANGIYTLSDAQQLTAAGNFPTGRYTPSYSLRLKRASSSYLARTPTTAGNRQIWTYSCWVKRGEYNSTGDYVLLGVRPSAGSYSLFSLRHASATGAYGLLFEDTGITGTKVSSNLFKDVASWYHIVLTVDTTAVVATNRIKMYVNGKSVTSFISNEGYNVNPTQNANTMVNSTNQHCIGRDPYDPANYFDGYISDVNFIDGQSLDPSYFGQTDAATGTWVPKRYTGSYGTNGFYLKLDPNSTEPSVTADFLVIAGGGGGAQYTGSGGGGAGGYRTSAGTSGGGSSAEPTFGVYLSTPYIITVGAGGAGGASSTQPASGSNSVLGYIVSTGGGGGAGYTGSSAFAAKIGGSGGGGNYLGNGGAVSISGQGYAGGNGMSGGPDSGGGGGGAGSVGVAGIDGVGGNGGSGLASSITGSSVTRGGGGGGSRYPSGTAGSGGSGGGGNGGVNGSGVTAGSSNTGGGGGANGSPTTSNAGANGGSGVIIIKIPNTYTATFSGGVTSSLSTSVSGYKIYTVTATSTTNETVTFS